MTPGDVRSSPLLASLSVEELVRVFRRIDENGDGKICGKELYRVVELFSRLVAEVKNDEGEFLLEEEDLHSDGEASRETAGHRRLTSGEFADDFAIPTRCSSESPEPMAQAFRGRPGGDSAPASPLHWPLRDAAEEERSRLLDQVSSLLNQVDANGDGCIDLDEFLSIMRGESPGAAADVSSSADVSRSADDSSSTYSSQKAGPEPHTAAAAAFESDAAIQDPSSELTGSAKATPKVVPGLSAMFPWKEAEVAQKVPRGALFNHSARSHSSDCSLDTSASHQAERGAKKGGGGLGGLFAGLGAFALGAKSAESEGTSSHGADAERCEDLKEGPAHVASNVASSLFSKLASLSLGGGTGAKEKNALARSPSQQQQQQRQEAQQKQTAGGILMKEQDLRGTFRMFDLNGDGYISPEELSLVLSRLEGCSCKHHKPQPLHHSGPLVRNGSHGHGCTLASSTLCRRGSEHEGPSSKSSRELFLSSIKCCNRAYSIPECMEMIRRVDKNHDGRVDFQEFAVMMSH